MQNRPIWIVVIIALLILGGAYYFKGHEAVAPTTPTPAPTPVVAENPEGEANPDVMKLDMKTWNWISALYNDGTEIKPSDSKKFALTFKNDGTFSASTDCNGIGGNYVVKGNLITFSEMMSTQMYCEGSKEGDFSKILQNTASYFFTSKGELILEIKYDSGTATFR